MTPLPVNVSDVDQKAKQSAFSTYAQHDKQVWALLANGASTPYDSWLIRQYRVDQSRSLIACCRRLRWRVGLRAQRLAWAAYAKLRPLLVHLPFFATLRDMTTRRYIGG